MKIPLISDLFQIGYQDGSRQRIGHLSVWQTPGKTVVRLVSAEERSEWTKAFSHSTWRNAEKFNKNMRALGILWRRSVSEAEYSTRKREVKG